MLKKLKSVLPATKRFVIRKSNELKKQNAKLRDEIKLVNKKLDALLIRIGELDEQKLDNMTAELRRLNRQVRLVAKGTIPEFKYNNRREQELIKDFYPFITSDDIKNKFLTLAHGLDNESRDLLAKMITRQLVVLDSELPLDFYSDEDKRGLIALRKKLRNEIYKISEDCYCFQGYLLPINHFEASVFVDRHGLNKLINPELFANKSIVDVGGFIGDSALVFSPLTKDKVYSFEASGTNFALMEKTIALNELKNVEPIHLSLGSDNGELEIDYRGSCTSAVLNKAFEAKYKETCKMSTLDDYASKHDLSVGLIKVDIEGYEQQFLKGAEQTIRRQKPTLLISIYHTPDDFYYIKPLIESWDLGYTFTLHKPLDFSISQEVLLIAEIR